MLFEPDLPGVSTVRRGTDTVIGDASAADWMAADWVGVAAAGIPASEATARERPRAPASA
jgi:hypothetical protein